MPIIGLHGPVRIDGVEPVAERMRRASSDPALSSMSIPWDLVRHIGEGGQFGHSRSDVSPSLNPWEDIMKLYGFGPTRSLRVLWGLLELGAEFEFVSVKIGRAHV